jgi:hypothetical protein
MPNKRGNQGYGKTKMIRQNFDKFSPVFWELMEKMARSKVKEDQKFFIQEFNKIQTKMIPQEVGGINGEPIKIEWQQSPSLTVPASGQSNFTKQSNAG